MPILTHLISRTLRALTLLAAFTFLSPQPLRAIAPYPNNEEQLLIINAYNEAGPWSRDIIVPVSALVANMPGVWADIAHLNSTIVTDSIAYKRMADNLFNRYAGSPPNYVVMVGNICFSLMERIKQEWGDVPVVLVTRSLTFGDTDHYFTDAENHGQDDNQHFIEEVRGEYNFTAIYVPDLYQETVDLMVEMLPKMKKLVFLADKIFLNRMLSANIRDYLAKKYPYLEYEWLVGCQENGQALHNYLFDENPEVGMLISTWVYERTGVHGAPMLIAGEFYMLPMSNEPVFSIRDSYLQYGAIGGVYPDPEGVREAINNAVVEMVNGTPAREIPFFYPQKNATVLSWPQLQESKIDINHVPRNAVFVDKPPTFLERYFWHLVVSILIASLIVATAMAMYRSQQRRLKWLNTYHRLVGHMPIAYTEARIVRDPDGHPQSLDYSNSNNAFLSLLYRNYVPDRGYKIIPPNLLHEKIGLLFESGKPVRFTHYFSESDTYCEFLFCLPSREGSDVTTENIEIFAIDITKSSKAEIQLKETAHKLDITLNAARIIPWQWDLRSRVFKCEAHRIFKNLNVHARFLPNELTYLIDEDDYLQSIHPDDLLVIQQMKADLIARKINHCKVEFRMVYVHNGRSYIEWFEASADVGKVADGGTIHSLVGSLLIITQRKRQEQALMAATNRAQESDRLKSAFLANMSHDIRTPLNAIVGFSNLLINTDDEVKKSRFASIINNNNNLLLQLVNDVLDLAKIESNSLDFNFAPVEVKKYIETMSHTVSIRIPAKVTFNLVPAIPDDCVTRTDPNRVAQVLINLLTNACKFTSHGSITLSCEIVDGMLYFEVRDTGIGIDPEDRDKLFRRFGKLNDFAQGTGLGLSISKSIIEKLGGSIGVNSRGKGKGSTFWFTIPYIPCEPEHDNIRGIDDDYADNEHEKRTLAPALRHTVLVADDNESNFLLINSILEQDYNVIRAHNGKEAVELAQTKKPVIILMDLAMPVMDGLKAAEEIRKFDRDTPIIAVTAYAMSSDQVKVMETKNFDSYMAKPIDSTALLNQIKSLINANFLFI